jgi:hypothetical protein
MKIKFGHHAKLTPAQSPECFAMQAGTSIGERLAHFGTQGVVIGLASGKLAEHRAIIGMALAGYRGWAPALELSGLTRA